MSDGCVFCDIAEGRAPSYIVAENGLAFALLDIQPLSEGHCLVVPKRHVAWWDELTDEETGAVFRLAKLTADKIRRAFAPDCVTMYARGRRMPHTHVFLVPTFESDPLDRLFNALEGFQEQAGPLADLKRPERMQAVWERLRDA